MMKLDCIPVLGGDFFGENKTDLCKNGNSYKHG
jgi:hypothetical protein